jgi:glycosyltransferase
MNKGFSYATGDIIGYLNSDDYYLDENILAEVVRAFELNQCDYVYGDVEMIDKSGKLIRHWITGEISPGNMYGKQIPHPAFFVKKEFLEKLLVVFDDSYRIAADLKQQLIIINKLKASGHYIQKSLVVMRLGGESTRSFFSYINGWIESRRAYNDVFGSGGTFFTLRKVLTKLKSIRSARIFEW